VAHWPRADQDADLPGPAEARFPLALQVACGAVPAGAQHGRGLAAPAAGLCWERARQPRLSPAEAARRACAALVPAAAPFMSTQGRDMLPVGRKIGKRSGRACDCAPSMTTWSRKRLSIGRETGEGSEPCDGAAPARAQHSGGLAAAAARLCQERGRQAQLPPAEVVGRGLHLYPPLHHLCPHRAGASCERIRSNGFGQMIVGLQAVLAD
jgi:hypothetical protein